MAARQPSGPTPALRVLLAAGVPHTCHSYAHDPAVTAFGEETAAALGVSRDQLFKTLLAQTDVGLAVGIVPVSTQLDLKALAHALGSKRATMAEPRAAERATGYLVGGISPLGMKAALPMVLDHSAERLDSIYVSGGRRGLQVELAPGDLVALTGAVIGAIAR